MNQSVVEFNVSSQCSEDKKVATDLDLKACGIPRDVLARYPLQEVLSAAELLELRGVSEETARNAQRRIFSSSSKLQGRRRHDEGNDEDSEFTGKDVLKRKRIESQAEVIEISDDSESCAAAEEGGREPLSHPCEKKKMDADHEHDEEFLRLASLDRRTLQGLCRERTLSTSGTVEELVSRIFRYNARCRQGRQGNIHDEDQGSTLSLKTQQRNKKGVNYEDYVRSQPTKFAGAQDEATPLVVDICVLLDQRERIGMKRQRDWGELLQDALKEHREHNPNIQWGDITYRVETIPVGDFAFEATFRIRSNHLSYDGTSEPFSKKVMLPVFIERKNKQDLIHSIKGKTGGNRYNEQKQNMKRAILNFRATLNDPPNSSFGILIYLLEHCPLSSGPWSNDVEKLEKTIRSAMLTTMLVDGFAAFYTLEPFHSARMLVHLAFSIQQRMQHECLLTDSIEWSIKNWELIVKSIVEKTFSYDQSQTQGWQPLLSYEEWSSNVKRKQSELDLGLQYPCMLSVIRGAGNDHVKLISSLFPSMIQLYQYAKHQCHSREEFVMQLKQKLTSIAPTAQLRALDSVLSILYDVLTNTEYI